MTIDDYLDDEYDENSPCSGCPHEGACIFDPACEDFLHFVGTGEHRDQSREPSRERYHKLFLLNKA